MMTIELTRKEVRAVKRLAEELAVDQPTSDDPALLRELIGASSGLPNGVSEPLLAYLGTPEAAVVIVRNHDVDDQAIGPTPTAWRANRIGTGAVPYEILTLLYGSLLGEVFGWATQQDGQIVNDILPVPRLAEAQVGGSSKTELAWHTEDAFHPGRADFICLFCLRNPDRAATTFACLADAISEHQPSEALFDPCVTISPDDAQAEGASLLNRCPRAEVSLEPVPILTYADSGLSMRIDPAYMEVWPSLDNLKRDVADLCAALNANLREVVLSPGDLLVIDNRRAVHGRRPFRARYDGNDRWLKRVNVAKEFSSRLPYCTDPARRVLS